MASDSFTLARSEGQEYRLVREGDGLALNRATDDAGEDELLGVLDRDRTRELLLWVGGEGTVTAVFDGPMANEIKKASQELALPEQAIVWNAVKLFLEVGDQH